MDDQQNWMNANEALEYETNSMGDRSLVEPSSSGGDDLPAPANWEPDAASVSAYLRELGLASVGEERLAGDEELLRVFAELALHLRAGEQSRRRQDEQLARAEMDLEAAQQQRERLEGRIEAAKQAVQFERTKLRQAEEDMRKERRQWKTEREELQVQIVKLRQRDSQYVHKLRKQETEYEKLQERLTRSVGEKQTVKTTVTLRAISTKVVAATRSSVAEAAKRRDADVVRALVNLYDAKQQGLLAESELMQTTLARLRGTIAELAGEAVDDSVGSGTLAASDATDRHLAELRRRLTCEHGANAVQALRRRIADQETLIRSLMANEQQEGNVTAEDSLCLDGLDLDDSMDLQRAELEEQRRALEDQQRALQCMLERVRMNLAATPSKHITLSRGSAIRFSPSPFRKQAPKTTGRALPARRFVPGDEPAPAALVFN